MKVERINTIIMTSQELIDNITKNSNLMKQTVEAAAIEYAYNVWKDRGGILADDRDNRIALACIDFAVGAHSEAAKEFHTQGMYSEEELKTIATEFFYHWYNVPGTNTVQGFDEFFKMFKEKRYGTEGTETT